MRVPYASSRRVSRWMRVVGASLLWDRGGIVELERFDSTLERMQKSMEIELCGERIDTPVPTSVLAIRAALGTRMSRIVCGDERRGAGVVRKGAQRIDDCRDVDGE